MSDTYDLVVIGGGPAGERGAAQAAYFGKRVAIVEREPEPGGTAVHTGTLPSKTLRETALLLSGHRQRNLDGLLVDLDPEMTVTRLLERKDAVRRLELERIHTNIDRHGIDLVRGVGRLIDPHTVEVTPADGSSTRLTAGVILVATGSSPYRPPGIPYGDEDVHDADGILRIHRLPSSMAVIGGGVIGCEYACMFAALGVRVTLVDARESLLTFLDHDMVDQLTGSMRRMGVAIRVGLRWQAVRRQGDDVIVAFDNGEEIAAEHLLYAAGREGRTKDLNLVSVGLQADQRGYLQVNERYETRVPHILAAGDVIGFPALAATSMEQGRVAVCHAFGFDYKKSVAGIVPYGIYTIPEVSAFGETETTCREKGIPYVTGSARYSENARGKIAGDTEGVLKLVVDRRTRRLIGVHVIGERATELVHIGQAVVHLDGSIDTFIEMVFNFPSLAEAYKYAAYDCLAQLAKPPAVPLPQARKPA